VLRERAVHLSHIEGTTISDIVTNNGIARTNLHRRLPPRLPQVITVGGPAPPPRDKRAVGRGINHVVRKTRNHHSCPVPLSWFSQGLASCVGLWP